MSERMSARKSGHSNLYLVEWWEHSDRLAAIIGHYYRREFVYLTGLRFI